MERLAWWKSKTTKTAIAVIGFGAIGLGALAVVIVVPWWQTRSLRQGVEDYRAKFSDSKSLDAAGLKEIAALEKARLDTENAMRTSLIQAVGGTVLLVGLYFTYQNLKATQRNVAIAEDKQVTERFGKAVEMLSSASLHTRLGGIYALERLARDSDNDYGQVMEVLCAFVREESPWPPKQAESDGATVEEQVPEPVELPQTEELSLVVEGKISQSAEPQPELPEPEQSLPNRNAFLATLPTLRTDIQAAMTVLGRRKYRYGDGETQGLDLQHTDLRKLQAQEANLAGVNLFGSHLEGAFLLGSHLEGASLYTAHLEWAEVSKAYLEEAWLARAHLKNAHLYETHLEGATLIGAHLEGVNLSQVKGLTQEDLDSAFTDKDTILPPGLRHRWEKETPTPSSVPPPDPPASPSPTKADPSSPATPDPTPEPPPPAPES